MSPFVSIHSVSMATRIVENLPVQADRNTISNWLKRLTAGIDLELFKCNDKLPTDPAQKAEKVEFLKKNILISNIGGPGLGELSSLTAPQEPEELKYNDLNEKLKKHYAPTPNKIGEEYRYSKLVQESGESLSAFFIRLKVAAQTCDFCEKYDQIVMSSNLYDSFRIE